MSDETFADRELSIEDRIDAKIDRDIKQLGQIKTMKALGIGRSRSPARSEPVQTVEGHCMEIENRRSM
jgi:hypothetical protein